MTEYSPPWLAPLNKPQREAVETLDGPLLVLAGAGTGKTRVLTTRIAQLIHTGRAKPHEIVSVTFTNKAAGEMRSRLEDMVGPAAQSVFSGTFHSLCLRILRAHVSLTGLQTGFTIIDTDDQIRLLKRVNEEAGIDEARWPARNLCWLIQRWKDRAWTPDLVPEQETDYFADGRALELYRLYQTRLESLNVCDFGDLLLRTILLLSQNAEILAIYHKKLTWLLVDEYQDTNVAQYLWLRLLAQARRNICCVGDDDQSIYGWRGAEVSNILRFEQDFQGAKTIRLEQNYRSTPHILAAASHIIANNHSRLGKTLWTQAEEGEKISVLGLPEASEEARYLVSVIAKRERDGDALSSMAILVRAGYQTREIEEALLESGIPYRIIGGARFYEREEIRDIIAYLRLLNHFGDDLAFERIINKPSRGIGKTSLDLLRHIARDQDISLFAAGEKALEEKRLKPQGAASLEKILGLFRQWQRLSEKISPAELANKVILESGYLDFWKKSTKLEAAAKIDNIRELLTSMEEMERLESFLEHIALVTEMDTTQGDGHVTVMTMHGAKGLEFDTVMLAGWEEGLFPSRRTIEESGQKGLEEERRLAYVALTRARCRIFISFSALRRVHGQWQPGTPSRFIAELPEEHLNYVAPEAGLSASSFRGQGTPSRAGFRPAPSDNFLHEKPSSFFGRKKGNDDAPSSAFRPGDACRHETFGEGEVLGIEGRYIRARFPDKGALLLNAGYLEKIAP